MKINDQKETMNNNINKSALEKKGTNMLLAAFMIFILPLIFIFLGAFLGGYISKAINLSTTTAQVVGGIVGLALSAVIIKLFDKASKIDENAEKIEWDDL
jgi:positive regulator of sigma E activity